MRLELALKRNVEFKIVSVWSSEERSEVDNFFRLFSLKMKAMGEPANQKIALDIFSRGQNEKRQRCSCHKKSRIPRRISWHVLLFATH